MKKLYKILSVDGEPVHGGTGKWHLPKGGRPGKWMPAVPVKLCSSGYHLTDAAHGMSWMPRMDAFSIYEAEGRGLSEKAHDKTAFEQARLLRLFGKLDARKLRLFASDCAEKVLHLYEAKHPNDKRPREAIDVARRYAEGKATEEERRAAAAAAADAYAAAYADAAAAAAAAAYDAAYDAAYADASAAAYDAAYAAAYADAEAAKKRMVGWQFRLLLKYAKGEKP